MLPPRDGVEIDNAEFYIHKKATRANQRFVVAHVGDKEYTGKNYGEEESGAEYVVIVW